MKFEMKNQTPILVPLVVITSLTYCHVITSRLPTGKWRLISLLPIFYIFTLLPLYISSAFLTAVLSFFITWLASFKLLLFAFDQGPLSSAKSVPVFIAVASLPFQIKAAKTKSDRPGKVLPLNLATEIPASVVLIQILISFKPRIHPYGVMALYCCLTFLLVEVLVAVSSLVVRVMFGMDLEPPSDEPYLSTSLREFWGKRWNLTVGGLLKDTVYKPILAAMDGGSVVVAGVLTFVVSVLMHEMIFWWVGPSSWETTMYFVVQAVGVGAVIGGGSVGVAVIATFVVSGLMHEMIFWYMTPWASPSWEMTTFFLSQGVGVVVESAVEKWRRKMPAVVRGALTLGFVGVTSFWLFFTPIIRNGADVRVVEEFDYVLDIFKLNLLSLRSCYF